MSQWGRDFWWLLLVLWLLAEVRCFVAGRLVYWQRRHIEALQEEARLNAQLWKDK